MADAAIEAAREEAGDIERDIDIEVFNETTKAKFEFTQTVRGDEWADLQFIRFCIFPPSQDSMCGKSLYKLELQYEDGTSIDNDEMYVSSCEVRQLEYRFKSTYCVKDLVTLFSRDGSVTTLNMRCTGRVLTLDNTPVDGLGPLTEVEFVLCRPLRISIDDPVSGSRTFTYRSDRSPEIRVNVASIVHPKTYLPLLSFGVCLETPKLSFRFINGSDIFHWETSLVNVNFTADMAVAGDAEGISMEEVVDAALKDRSTEVAMIYDDPAWKLEVSGFGNMPQFKSVSVVMHPLRKWTLNDEGIPTDRVLVNSVDTGDVAPKGAQTGKTGKTDKTDGGGGFGGGAWGGGAGPVTGSGGN